MASEDTYHVSLLAQECAEAMARYRRCQPYDPASCYELFQLALVCQDQVAWSILFEQYSGLVRHWVQGAPGDPNDLVNEAFARFCQTLSPDRFEQFSSLEEILGYLKRCAQSAAIDARRREERERVRESLIIQMREAIAEKRWDSPVEHVLDKVAREELYERALTSLRDSQEQLVFRATFEWAMTPREIARRWPQMFASAQEVSRTKERILRRLRRDREIKRLWGVEDGENSLP